MTRTLDRILDILGYIAAMALLAVAATGLGLYMARTLS